MTARSSLFAVRRGTTISGFLLAAALATLAAPAPARGAALDFNQGVRLKASYRAEGYYNLVGLIGGTWNGVRVPDNCPAAPDGQPLPAGCPPFNYRQLNATIEFYVPVGQPNVLYVRIKDVVGGPGASWWGSAFTGVTMTGVRFHLPFAQAPATPVYDGGQANPGQRLAPGDRTEVPIDHTPGYFLTASDTTYLVQTSSGPTYGFTQLGGIYGDKRLKGSQGAGVYTLTFAPGVDLNRDVTWWSNQLTVEAQWGRPVSNQYIAGVSNNVDSNPPTITWSGNAGLYTVDQEVHITCTATDAESGIASSTCEDVIGPAYLFTIGENVFSATATDNAGNVATAETRFTVAVTPESLINLIHRFVADEGIANALASKIEAAVAAGERGNGNAMQGVLKAFTNQLDAQSGKSIAEGDADLLARLAGYL